MTDQDARHSKGVQHKGHCVLCTPAPHGNRDEFGKVSMQIDDLEADVRVCREHFRVIERCLRILHPDGEWEPPEVPR